MDAVQSLREATRLKFDLEFFFEIELATIGITLDQSQRGRSTICIVKPVDQLEFTLSTKYMTIPELTTDFDITCDIACSAVATGATIFGGIVARVVDADNLYYLRLNFLTTGAVQLELRERTAAVEATLGTAFTLAATYAADTYFRVRFQGSGSTLRGKAWLASGGAEPDVWQVSATDSTATGTTMGLRSISSAGTTNVNPEIRFQNFQLLNPQALNVQRSVNGVVKAHSLGDPLSLTYPMHLAL